MNIYSEIENQLIQISNIQDKIILEKYFKNVIKFIWVKGPWIKLIFKNNKQNIFSLNNDEQNELWFMFLKSNYFEMKQIWICIFESKYKKLDENFLIRIKSIIIDYIYDWWNCDTLSSRVMWNMIRNNWKYAQIIQNWSHQKHTWIQRSSCISFVKNAKLWTYNKEIIQICNNVLTNPERFAQLWVWWLLRELSVIDKKLVIKYIIENYQLFSREWLRYAIEKMNIEEKRFLMDLKNNIRPNSKV